MLQTLQREVKLLKELYAREQNPEKKKAYLAELNEKMHQINQRKE
jgi:hypothetical protein